MREHVLATDCSDFKESLKLDHSHSVVSLATSLTVKLAQYTLRLVLRSFRLAVSWILTNQMTDCVQYMVTGCRTVHVDTARGGKHAHI